MNKYEDYKTLTDLRTKSAINRMALEKLNAESCEFKVGDMVFFILLNNSMMIGTIIKARPKAYVVDCEGKKWLVQASRLNLF